MDIRSKIRMAEFATSLGLIEAKDWKTPKILSGSYRSSVTRKAICNAAKVGYGIVKNHKR